jgi:hypothetical protein
MDTKSEIGLQFHIQMKTAANSNHYAESLVAR